MLQNPIGTHGLNIAILEAQSGKQLQDLVNNWLEEHRKVVVHDIQVSFPGPGSVSTRATVIYVVPFSK